MKTLIAPNEDFIKIERTELTADVAAGTNVTLALLNNDGMANNTFIAIGREGGEKCELQMINAAVTPGTSAQVATLLFAHKAGEQVTVYKYNKRKFYGALTATGAYTELTTYGSPVLIAVDDPQGTRLEYTGAEGYLYFKSTYYNSVTASETDLDDSTAVLGNQTGRYTSLYAIRVQAGLTNNPYITDGRIEEKRRQAENEINSTLIVRYTLPLSEVPGLIARLCTLLAAGYIDFEEFGPEGNGVKWLGEARGILKSIQNGTQRLIGESMTELPTNASTNVLRGKPDGTEEGRDRRAFSMSDRY
jgi:phage gp36-like protein